MSKNSSNEPKNIASEKIQFERAKKKFKWAKIQFNEQKKFIRAKTQFKWPKNSSKEPKKIVQLCKIIVHSSKENS